MRNATWLWGGDSPLSFVQGASEDEDEISDRDLRKLYPRPRTRAQCVDGPRPCPYVTCRYHMLTEVTDLGQPIYHVGLRMGVRVTSDIVLETLLTMPQTCALDVSDEAELSGAEITLEEIKNLMQLSRERIRQIEGAGFKKIRGTALGLELVKLWRKRTKKKKRAKKKKKARAFSSFAEAACTKDDD